MSKVTSIDAADTVADASDPFDLDAIAAPIQDWGSKNPERNSEIGAFATVIGATTVGIAVAPAVVVWGSIFYTAYKAHGAVQRPLESWFRKGKHGTPKEL